MYTPNPAYEDRQFLPKSHLKIELYMIEKYWLFLDTIFIRDIIKWEWKIILLTNPWGI